MPVLKGVKMPLSSCSLSVGQMFLRMYVSNTLTKGLKGLADNSPCKFRVGFSYKCSAGSELLFFYSCLFHRVLVLQTVSPI